MIVFKKSSRTKYPVSNYGRHAKERKEGNLFCFFEMGLLYRVLPLYNRYPVFKDF